jgi:hypothetical protein
MDWARLAIDVNAQDVDHVFAISDDGRVVDGPAGMYGPERCEHDDESDMLIDGVPYRLHPEWTALTNMSGQYNYGGPVMHSSEHVSRGMAEWLARGFDRGTPMVMCVVESGCDDECDDECCDEHEAAGWTIMVRKSVTEQ